MPHVSRAVRTPATPDYVGETTYYFDSVANTVEYIYLENHGGVSRGKVESAPDGKWGSMFKVRLQRVGK